MPKVKLPFEARYYVEKETGCWIWIRRTKSKTYGWFGHRTTAHRASWERVHGPVPPGKYVMHVVCDRPLCVNPAHLGLGTNQDNLLDAVSKGRAKGVQITPEIREQIFEAHKTGLQQAEIAEKFGVSPMTVSRIWARRGIHRQKVCKPRPQLQGEKAKQSKLTDREREEIWDMRNSGWSYHEIGKAYGVTEGAISHLYRKRGYRQHATWKRGQRESA